VPPVLGTGYVLGAGGDALPMYMKLLVPDLDLVVVDRSEGVLRLAQQYFGMTGVRVVQASADTYLRTIRGAARIVLDIASNWTEDGESLLSNLSPSSLRSADGMLIVNLVLAPGEGLTHGLRWLKQLQQIASHVVVLVLNQNAVFYCSTHFSASVSQILAVQTANEREHWGYAYYADEFGRLAQ